MMRQPLALLLLLLSASFPPAASFPPEAAPDPDTFLLLKLGEGKEGIVGAQLADGENLAELTSNQLQIQSDYNEVQLNTNTKTNTILDTIEAVAVRETSHRQHDDLLGGSHAVHLDEELVERLLALLVAAAEALGAAPLLADGVDLIYVYDTGGC